MTDPRHAISNSPDETFELGALLGRELRGGEVILLTGGLGAGKTLLTKGILSSLDFDIDEVTSPSFALVNLYRTGERDVYHIDLWRSDDGDAAFSVGLEEILEDEGSIVIIEWAERIAKFPFRSTVYRINLNGDGDEPRRVTIECVERTPAASL